MAWLSFTGIHDTYKAGVESCVVLVMVTFLTSSSEDEPLCLGWCGGGDGGFFVCLVVDVVVSVVCVCGSVVVAVVVSACAVVSCVVGGCVVVAVVCACVVGIAVTMNGVFKSGTYTYRLPMVSVVVQ